MKRWLQFVNNAQLAPPLGFHKTPHEKSQNRRIQLVLVYLIIAGIAFASGWFLGFRDTRQKEQDLRSRTKANEEEIDRQKREIAEQNAAVERKREKIEVYHSAQQQELRRLTSQVHDLKKELTSGFFKGREWLARAYSEFIATRDAEVECSLVIKPNPAWKAAETVSQLAAKRREMATHLKRLQYQLASYEEYFPFLIDYREAILDEVIDIREGDIDALEEIDPALGLGYLSKDEYKDLSNTDKFQLALDRYWSRKKSNIEIGRLYERYVGYLYEKDGWAVRYEGILKGFEDFGRDLICTKDGLTSIVQCKCWKKAKVIREKHIMQLYGTCILYRITENCPHANPVFMTTTDLSHEAQMVANELGVTVRNKNLERYPMIKCNVNPRTKDRIFHLPFDQQYDNVIVGNETGEFYAETIQAAEGAGFRRAHRWQGGDETTA